MQQLREKVENIWGLLLSTAGGGGGGCEGEACSMR